MSVVAKKTTINVVSCNRYYYHVTVKENAIAVDPKRGSCGQVHLH